MVTQSPMQQLELVAEAKVFDILGGRLDPRLEASGVLAKDGLFYVIFDNLPHIARIGPELSPAAAANAVIRQKKGHSDGFEDIAYDAWHGRFYVLIESLPRGNETYMAKVQEYDDYFRYLGQAWLDFPLDRPNKGLEGLTCVRRDGQTYLLGLCEGNRCRGGKEGGIPGGGRVHVFQRGEGQWERVGKIRLPETVQFVDYSGIAVAGDRIAVISQMTSALWVGQLAPSGWEVTGDGTCYALPTGADGGMFMAAVQEYDADFGYTGRAWLDFPLDRPNKGLEGLTCVRRDGQAYLLGLCEGNRCKGGAEGRIPGGGRVQVFRRGQDQWDRVARIRLPETVLFQDYSGIAVADGRIAVVSQESSALWVGNLAPDGWELTGAGLSYALPRSADGSIIYGTAEGVSWMAPDQVVMVSDKAKPEQDPRCRAKDQSIHIFRIPASAP